jgi:hypothetical protein
MRKPKRLKGRDYFEIPFPRGDTMTQETKPPTFTDAEVKREIVNDSLGTVDTADSTGSDETKETGDAKMGNTKTRED